MRTNVLVRQLFNSGGEHPQDPQSIQNKLTVSDDSNDASPGGVANPEGSREGAIAFSFTY